jgi:hypothetical protein
MVNIMFDGASPEYINFFLSNCIEPPFDETDLPVVYYDGTGSVEVTGGSYARV